MLKAYLAGPIEFKPDLGREWRLEITPRLLELGIEVIDPTSGMISGQVLQNRVSAYGKAKAEKNWPEFAKNMHAIWVMNKRWVDSADFLIVYCKDSDNMSGTIREMHEAYEYHKPIFLVVDGDPRKVKSHTLYMALKRGKIFQNFEELFDYLKHAIDNQSLKKRHIDLFQVTQKLLIVNDQNQLLILKAAIHGLYDVPGGRLDMQEFTAPLLECLDREVREELGSEVRLKINYKPIGLGRELLFDKILQQDHYRRIFIIGYEAKYLGGEIKLSNEHESYKWVDVKTFDPSGKFRPGHGAIVREFLRQNNKQARVKKIDEALAFAGKEFKGLLEKQGLAPKEVKEKTVNQILFQ